MSVDFGFVVELGPLCCEQFFFSHIIPKMRFFWILGYCYLLIVSSKAEEKINLEDIERDNLRSESKSTPISKQTSYSTKSDVNDRDYHQLSAHQYQGQNTDGLGSYTTAQPDENKYPEHDNQYQHGNSPNDIRYQDDTTATEVHGTSQLILQYPEYGHQIDITSKTPSTQIEQQRPIYYEPEVAVGNQYQTVQQKAATKKYVKNDHKGAIYIPMNQLLAYYSHSPIDQGSSAKREPLLHRQTDQANQQRQIPIYTPALSHTASINSPSRQTYVIRPQYLMYPSQSDQHTQAIIKTGKNQVYSQDNQAYTSPNELLYTQTVLAQPQTQYLQEIVYTQPKSLYAQVTPGHASTYDGEPDYVQGAHAHALSHIQTAHLEQYNQYDEPQRYIQYIVAAKPVYRTQQAKQNFDQKIPGTPSEDFTPPQLPPQNFKSTNEQYSVSDENERVEYSENHIGQSYEPKSLLDSYIPSYIIAAKDPSRYQDRPIKLESGFLPSNINFIHSFKKRKAE